jgi:hypothetical protein
MDTLQEWLAAARHGDDALPTEAHLGAVESQMGLQLPAPVRLVLTTTHRPEGFVGESYIAFFTVDDLAQCWAEAQRTSPGFIPFASNGAVEWYGLDSRVNPPAFVLIPAIGGERSTATLLGAAWDDFWETLKRGDLFDHVYRQA